MRRSGSILPRYLIVVVVLCAAISAAVASARPGTAILTQGEVVRAFASSGLKLQNPEIGFLQPVTTLNLLNPNPGYSLGVSIYPSTTGARRAYQSGEPGWRVSGYAVALVRNVLVAVVPRGAKLGHKAPKPFPMPVPIAASVARLNR
jgi:hypothetical protein